jgi:hypothetical protein
MKRNNYYAVILENGYLEDVCLSREEAEKKAASINGGDFSAPDYATYEATVVRGIENIKLKAKGHWTTEEIKQRALGC